VVLSLAVLNAWMSDLGYSRLTHTTECPFRIDTGASDDKESTVDSNIEAGYLNSVLNAVMSFTALLFMMKFKFDDDNKLEFIITNELAKQKIAKSIVNAIHQLNSIGRFLKLDKVENTYFDI